MRRGRLPFPSKVAAWRSLGTRTLSLPPNPLDPPSPPRNRRAPPHRHRPPCTEHTRQLSRHCRVRCRRRRRSHRLLHHLHCLHRFLVHHRFQAHLPSSSGSAMPVPTAGQAMGPAISRRAAPKHRHQTRPRARLRAFNSLDASALSSRRGNPSRVIARSTFTYLSARTATTLSMSTPSSLTIHRHHRHHRPTRHCPPLRRPTHPSKRLCHHLRPSPGLL